MEKEVTKSYEIYLPRDRMIESFFKNQSNVLYIYEKEHELLDWRTDDYRLVISLSDNLDANQVLVYAGELMSLLCGYLKLYEVKNRSFFLSDHKEFKELTIFNNTQSISSDIDRLQIPNFLLYDIMQKQDRSICLLKDIKKEIYSSKKYSYSFEIFLYLAYKSIKEFNTDSVKKAPDVYVLLKYLSYKIDWVVLYKIYESLEYFAQLEHYPYLVQVGKDLRLSSKDERDKFATPANMFSIIGFDARHGYQKVHPNCKTDVFSFDEARDFVFNHVKKYLKWKFDNFIQQEIFKSTT